MSTERVNSALRKLVKRQQTVPVISGTVTAVNGMLCDVQPSDGGAVIFDVRMKVASNEGDAGCYAVPMVGSRVLLVMLEGNVNAWALLQVETIDRWVLKLDTGAELVASQGGEVAINGDQYGGLVKVNELRTELQKVNTFLTALRTAISSAIPVPNDGGAALKIAITNAIAGQQLPTYSGIESTRTKHGGL
jgi:hypothetical protein